MITRRMLWVRAIIVFLASVLLSGFLLFLSNVGRVDPKTPDPNPLSTVSSLPIHLNMETHVLILVSMVSGLAFTLLYLLVSYDDVYSCEYANNGHLEFEDLVPGELYLRNGRIAKHIGDKYNHVYMWQVISIPKNRIGKQIQRYR